MRFEVDYENHPAFGSFIKHEGNTSALADSLRAIDAAVDEYVQGRDPDRRSIDAATQGLAGHIEQDADIEPGLKPFVVGACERALNRSVDEQTRRANWTVTTERATATARRDAEALLHQGIALYQMPEHTIDRLRSVLNPDIEKLRQIAAEAPEEIIVCFPTNPESQRIVIDYCSEAGIFDMLSAYYGENFRTVGFVIHYSHPKDKWFRVFDDLGLEMPRTTQMHYDLAFSPPKAMLYLNDVSEDQGAFSFIPKDTDWELFGIGLALKKEILYAVSYYTTETFGKSVTGNSSIFRYPEARRAFASLPRILRATAHQGDHILNDTPLSSALLKAERVVTGKAGTMPLFAGSHVLHRGGVVRSGERVALQIVFETAAESVPEPVPESRVQVTQASFMAKATGRLRRIGFRLGDALK
jgi:hypothetical protein